MSLVSSSMLSLIYSGEFYKFSRFFCPLDSAVDRFIAKGEEVSKQNEVRQRELGSRVKS